MKKWYIFIIIGLVLIAMLFGGLWYFNADSNEPLKDGVVASVNGVDILEQQVVERTQINQINNQMHFDYLKDRISDPTSLDTYLSNSIKATDRKDIINELVKAEIIRQNLEKDDKSLSKDETNQMWKNELKLLQTDEEQKNTYAYLVKSLESSQVSMDDYTKLSYSLAYDTYNIKAAQDDFFNSKDYQKNSILTKEEQFDLYVSHLIQKAKIQTIESID